MLNHERYKVNNALRYRGRLAAKVSVCSTTSPTKRTLPCSTVAVWRPRLTSVSTNGQALFFAVALVLNIVLCSVQAVVLVNLWEYSKDHMFRPHPAIPDPRLRAHLRVLQRAPCHCHPHPEA